ncbi:MAG: tetratricopeptide repeat protein [Candidatus Tisiphia sp.]
MNKNSHNFQIFDLYFSTIKDPKEALKYFEDKSKNNLTQRQDIHNILKKWQNHLSNQVNDKEVAAKTDTYASKYNPNPTVATAPVKKAVKEVERDKEKYDKSTLKLKTVVTLDVHTKQLEELKAKHESELKAELEKLKTEHKAELEALKPKTSPAKDTKVDEVGDSSTTSSLPPPYSSVNIYNSPYLKLGNTENTPTAPIAKPLDETVLAELTKLAHLIPSINWQDSNYNTTKGKAKSLLSEAVKENPDVYKTIENPKILVLLADVLLSSNKMEEARIVCKKALDNDPNIWQVTDDQIVLLNLAGVLLPLDQSKAEQIYGKAISIRIYFTDERGNYEMDVNRTTIVSKTVAQDGYSAAERDCLAKVCLGGKVYKQVQAPDCYPHTDVAKREAMAEQLKQLAKQMLLPAFPSYAAYTLCSKASSVLENDLELSQDMKKIYDYTCSHTALPKYSAKYSNYYPPTEESTTYLTGECANNDY